MSKYASHSHLPVSSLESHIGFWLRYVSNHVSGQFKLAVEARGVSVSEWVALRHLYECGNCSPAALLAALGMTKGAVSKIVSRLADKGLVSRAASEADGRAQSIILSAAGRRLVPKLARLADENDAAFFGHLPAARRRELIALMQDVVRLHQLKQVPVE